MKQRQSYRREMAQVLGVYSVATDIVIVHPRDLGADLDHLVSMHESIHKLLTMGTLWGFFQRALIGIASDLPKPHFAHAVPSKLIDLAWTLHEGTASYVELCLCAINSIDVQRHMTSFPADYVAAVTPLIDALGMPDGAAAPYQWIIAVYLAKLAMNGPVIDQLGTPEMLTPARFEAFAREHSPDIRFRILCSAVKKRGGLAPLLTQFSEELDRQWKRLRPGTRVPRTRWQSDDIVDLNAADETFKGEALTDAAEVAHQKIAASTVPQMDVRIGTDVMCNAIIAFSDAWSDLSPTASKIGASLVMRNYKEGHIAQRRYAVRVRLDGRPEEKTLDDLRSFLTLQAANDRITLAGFVETTSDEIAVWAVGTVGFGTNMRSSDVWLGSIVAPDRRHHPAAARTRIVRTEDPLACAAGRRTQAWLS
ncbi:MAG TPA: hypothetical protein VGA84_15635 [Thermoanaerobaculia bacterium]